MPGLHHIQVVDCTKMVHNTNVQLRKELEMQQGRGNGMAVPLFDGENYVAWILT